VYMGKMKLDDSLYEHIPLQQAAIDNPDSFGVEVELEGVNICNPSLAVCGMWTSHDDNSLRKLAPGDEAIEYVCRRPFNMKEIEVALTLLFDYLNKPPASVYESYRTSIHVHVNFGRETFRTIYNFITLSLLLDELLVSQNGDHRIGNNFCLRAKDALGQVVGLIESVDKGKNFFHIQANERYSSINFASLMKFGSIEFRSLECTTHLGRILHWIGTLQHLKDCAKTYKNPTEIISQYSQMGPRAFLMHVLGPFALKYVNVRGMDDMLHNGMRIAQDFAYCSAWKERTQADIAEEALAAKKAAIHKKQIYDELAKQLNGVPN
jgi:hypothetical protein